MPLTSQHKKHYRSIGHKLKPVVTVAGKGLSEGVLAELERALEDHELIKVKVSVEDRLDRKALSEALCLQTGSELIQNIGKVALIYRRAKEPDPSKSNAV